ncbi:MAG: hypothetical protein GX209_00845 [Epulopiscium sp.]|nr:hypothetical protein [Candidatus Epulonipiscium sp.]
MPEQPRNEKKSIFKKWWFWVLAILIVLVLANLGGEDRNQNQTQEPAPQEEITTPQDTAPQENQKEPEETSEKEIEGEEKTADAPGNNESEEQEAIEFSNVLANTDMGMTLVYGEVKNNDTKAHTFTVKVTFYDGSGKIMGTASGAVNDLNGGETKLFSAIGTDDVSNAKSHRVQVDTMISTEENSPSVITFSEPLIRSDGGITMVDVDTTNHDTSTHSFTVIIGFYDENNNLIGAASGAMNDLGAGETKTLSAMANGDFSNAASTKIYVDAIVQ